MAGRAATPEILQRNGLELDGLEIASVNPLDYGFPSSHSFKRVSLLWRGEESLGVSGYF